jgi:lipopolysaccharide transport system ATP-binding protein
MPNRRAAANAETAAGSSEEDYWALRNVSFDIAHGDVVGLIGRNGAGKSTLLKILSRIVDPSEGRARVRGRVASLLEVGTGFHPELTGRENIFLNGAILGMRRAEIASRFNEIVAFAEIEKFLDTPVKRYSSGMYVRLAFAVAAHLEPDILLVDEVLAVGDAQFQKKCLGKMEEVAGREGRTILFVSHNMGAVNRICNRCILLEGGVIKEDGEASEVTRHYLSSDEGSMAERHWRVDTLRPGDDVARLVAVRVVQKGQVSASVDIRYPVDVEMMYEVRKPGAQTLSALSFFDAQGTHLFVSADFAESKWSRARSAGMYISSCCIPGNIFAEGLVRIAVEVSTRSPAYAIHFLVWDVAAFQVIDEGEPGGVRAGWGRPIPGVVRPMCDWSTRPIAADSAESWPR